MIPGSEGQPGSTGRCNLIVDDDVARSRRLGRILREADFGVVFAGTIAEAKQQLSRQAVGLAIVDVVLPDGSGLALCQALRADPDFASLPILLLSGSMTSSRVQARGLELGAVGYLAWPVGAREFLARVRLAWRQGSHASWANHEQRQASVADAAPRLTERQQEILELVAQGLSTKAIAARLDISLRTAETHRAAILRRVGVHSTAALLARAHRFGLLAATGRK